MSTRRKHLLLGKLCFSPFSPAYLVGQGKLHQYANQHAQGKPQITLQEVKRFPAKQSAWGAHKLVKKEFDRLKNDCLTLDNTWQADLVDMQKHARYNQEYKYISTVVGCVSRYALTQPPKNKKPSSVVQAFTRIFASTYRRPDKIGRCGFIN